MKIKFFVEGNPVPKQSFRYAKTGNYIDKRVKAWQDKVSWKAKEVMEGRDPLEGNLYVQLWFYINDKRRKDWDNLSKGVMDGLNKIVFNDDSQIVHAEITVWRHSTMSNDYGVQVFVGHAERG